MQSSILFAGDFNYLCNLGLDKKGGSLNAPMRIKKLLNSFMICWQLLIEENSILLLEEILTLHLIWV